MSTRSGLRLQKPEVKKKVPYKRKAPESDGEDEETRVQLPGENAFERLEALLENTNNFAIPITQADIRAIHGNCKTKRLNKLQKTDALNMVAQGYDRTATFYDRTPRFIKGEMRDYQIEGLNWMISLQKAGLNGVLADEMGLGKTLQTIALLAHNKIVEKTTSPSIVIAPLPTILNWKDEVERFCPKLRTIVLDGTMDERKAVFKQNVKSQSFDICIMSYETAIKLDRVIQAVHFNYVVIDEAQRIKNDKVSLAVAVRSFHSTRRLLLTGTPFQNNVHELWALLHYLVPAIFDDAESFEEIFSSQNLSADVNLINRLHRIMNPFMLRRVKHDVEKSLMPKKEYKMYMGLTELQKKWYSKVLNKEIEIMNREGVRNAKKISHVLMALREVTNHPYMLPAAEPVGPPFVTDETIVSSSGKMMVLDKMLEKFQAEGSRCLIFSQFTMMLDILEDYAIWKQIKYSRFDGTTMNDERFDKVREFNAEGSDTFMFLMSTRAGGLGINLATADVVVIYDSDWNPQMDFQAIARAHRIGQKKQVRVFRLISEGTVDDYMMRTNEHKVRLGGVVIQDRQHQMEATKTKAELLEALNEAEHRIAAGSLESIGEIDLEKMFKDAEELAMKEANEKKKKLAESNRYLVHEKGEHEIWEYSGQNHWVNPNKEYKDRTVEDRLRKNPKKTEWDDHAVTTSEFWSRLGLHLDHYGQIWNYRFYPQRYVELCQKKFDYLNGQNQILYIKASEKVTKGDRKCPPLTDEEATQLHELAVEKACSWSFNRFSVYVKNLASTDRFDHLKLARSITCDEAEVVHYSTVLWERINELPNKDEILANVEEYAMECENNKKMTEMIGKKLAMFADPATEMTFAYALLLWDEPFDHFLNEDRFIVMFMHEKGYDTTSLGSLMQAIKLQPRSSYWPCQKAGSGVVKKRLTYLMKLIEKELCQPKLDPENAENLEETTNETADGADEPEGAADETAEHKKKPVKEDGIDEQNNSVY
ncbi:unnamed protein product [Caenorhabditis sp. 36 PRJEB53466]|nr:unnamed protein product [Caenorhabditis sp. 36 PRJEB53466]